MKHFSRIELLDSLISHNNRFRSADCCDSFSQEKPLGRSRASALNYNLYCSTCRGALRMLVMQQGS